MRQRNDCNSVLSYFWITMPVDEFTLGPSSGHKRPLDVPLDELQAAIRAANLRCERVGTSLLVTHEHFSTIVRVVKARTQAASTRRVQAVVEVRTILPEPLATLVRQGAGLGELNGFLTTTGALISDRGRCYIGSRLTIYEGECAEVNRSVWELQAQLLLATITLATGSLLGAMRIGLGLEQCEKTESLWKRQDFEHVRNYLSEYAACQTGAGILTAHLPLSDTGVQSPSGNTTALWQMSASTHPYAGGGLLCVLCMPHRFDDGSHLERVVTRLNKLEMAPRDLAPHFGAWARAGHYPAYFCFLPNALHATRWMGLYMAVGAAGRARWANGMLTSMGINK